MATEFANSDVMDGALKIIKSNANILTVCKGDPDTRAKAITSSKLADIVVSASDFTIATSGTGRKVTVGAQNSVSIDANGSAEAICICDGTRLLLKTTCTKQALVSGNKVNIPAFKDVIGAPS
jgi:hypothetical protein